MVVLRKVGVMSVAKIFAVISAIVGLIEGIVLAGLGSMMGDMLSGTPLGMLGMFGMYGYTAIIIFPVTGAISGFIGGAIGALLYNLVAGKIGGIEMNLIGLQAAAIPIRTQPATATLVCSRCGGKLSADAKFCRKCGVSVPTVAPEMTAPQVADAHPPPVVTPPPVAEVPSARFCEGCGAKISSTAKFCGKCGASQP